MDTDLKCPCCHHAFAAAADDGDDVVCPECLQPFNLVELQAAEAAQKRRRTDKKSKSKKNADRLDWRSRAEDAPLPRRNQAARVPSWIAPVILITIIIAVVSGILASRDNDPKPSTGPVSQNHGGNGDNPNRGGPNGKGDATKPDPAGTRTQEPKLAKEVTPPISGRTKLLKLPKVPDPLPITPSAIQAETAIQLPEPVAKIVVGGGGRFLILLFEKMRKFGIFDVNETKIVRYIPAAENSLHFAAGMTRLVVYLPTAGILQRWNLLTGEREHSVSWTFSSLNAFCMGSASEGPLLVSQGYLANTRFFDLEKLGPLDLQVEKPPYAAAELAGKIWANASGRVFGMNRSQAYLDKVSAIVIGEAKAKWIESDLSAWFAMPSPDGQRIFLCGDGAVDSRFRWATDVISAKNHRSLERVLLPAHHGPYYLHAVIEEERNSIPAKKKRSGLGDVHFYLYGESQPIATIPNTRIQRSPARGRSWVPGADFEDSIHLIPQAKLLAVIPIKRDEIRLYPIDLDAALERSGIDYLFVTSQPPSRARPGEMVEYQVVSRSKKGGLTYLLETGPKGMTISKEGMLQWKVPLDWTRPETEVIVGIKDKENKETFQKFALAIGDENP